MGIEKFKPVIALCLACGIWGLSGIYYDQLSHVPPVEVLAHRSLWAMIFFSLVLFCQRRLHSLLYDKLNFRELCLLSFSALMISINWFSFIYAIQTGQAVQASFGYYIFPLVAVVFGFLFKGERFSKIQLLAILFAGISVSTLGFALSLIPSIALIIALTFGAYGLIKGFTELSSIESVTIETILIAPLSVIFLILVYISRPLYSDNVTDRDLLLLMLSGVITGGPLILFSYATKQLTYATVGILQYLNPTLQFLVAIFVLMEPFNMWHACALFFIWVGIIIYSAESLRLESRK